MKVSTVTGGWLVGNQLNIETDILMHYNATACCKCFTTHQL